jgi:hypothetical protein
MVFEEKWFIIIHDKRCRCAMNHLLGKQKRNTHVFLFQWCCICFSFLRKYLFLLPLLFHYNYEWWRSFFQDIILKKMFQFCLEESKTKSSFGKGWELEFFRILVIFSKLITRQSSRSLKKFSRLILLNPLLD